MKREYIPAFTGLRAFCAYGIFFHHINIFSKETNPNLFRFVDQFYAFIPFFFVISGFVIFYTYYSETKFSKNELYNYFISRIARIFPILIIINTAVFILAYRENLYDAFETLKLYFLNITLLKGFSSKYLLTGVGPSWTNTVEEVFYLLTPMLFIIIRKKAFLVKFILATYLAGFLLTLLFIITPYAGILSSYAFTAYFTFLGRVFEFIVGIYLAMLYLGKYKNTFLEKYGHTTLLIGTAILAISFALLYFISSHYNVAHANVTWPGIAVNNFLFPLAIFLILYHLLYYNSLLKKILASPVTVKLGNATYSFYLLHTTFILSYIFKFFGTSPFAAFIAMLVISYVFHKTVEQPLTSMFRKKLSRKSIL